MARFGQAGLMGFIAKQRILLLSYWRKISFFAKKLSQNTKKVKKHYVFKAYALVHLQMMTPKIHKTMFKDRHGLTAYYLQLPS